MAHSTDQADLPSTEQIGLVQTSWEQCVPIAATAANLFYDKLFELDPRLRDLFPSDMAEQKQKLMTMITTAVRALGDLEALTPVVQALGRRHNDYQVESSQYDTVGAALLWTLEQGLGEAWNDELAAAWTKVYQLLARVMIDAAEAAR